MTITNGYCTLAEYNSYARNKSTDSDDDTTLERIIEAASRYIDTVTARRFFADTDETRYFDTPVPATAPLLFDEDCLAVTTLTNGDGETIADSDYQLLPANKSPKFGIQLKSSTGTTWSLDAYGNPYNAISVLGEWGNASSTPADITQACLGITKAWVDRRSGENTSGISRVTAAGIVITPEDIPGFAREILQNRRRIGFA